MNEQTTLLAPLSENKATELPKNTLQTQNNPFFSVLERVITNPEFSVEKLQALLKVQQEWDALQAKKAFDEAKAKFSGFAVKVTKDKANKQYDSRYTSLGNMVNTVTPYLAQCDLNSSWRIDQTTGIKVTCILRHSLGHEETASMTVPPDTSGAKNVIQQIKSSITYARNCTFESVCGLASTDGRVNVDDDGNSSGGSNALPEETVVQRLDGISNAGNHDELKRLYQAAFKEAEEAKDEEAKKDYIKAKNARYKELGRQ